MILRMIQLIMAAAVAAATTMLMICHWMAGNISGLPGIGMAMVPVGVTAGLAYRSARELRQAAAERRRSATTGTVKITGGTAPREREAA